MRYALIQGGVVVNVIEQESIPLIGGQWIDVTALAVGPGMHYANGEFLPGAAAPRHITQLAFLNRFTDAEAIAIDLASIGATQQAASLRRYLNKVNAAEYIDLDLAETRAGVQALETATLLGAGRAAVILDAPIAPNEAVQK